MISQHISQEVTYMKKEYERPLIISHGQMPQEDLALINLSGLTSRDDSGWTEWE